MLKITKVVVAVVIIIFGGIEFAYSHTVKKTSLSHGDSNDDFPSLAHTSDGTVYAVFTAYYNGYDQVRLRKRLKAGDWSTLTYVPLSGKPRADIWMPQIAVDHMDRLWVIWGEQTNQTSAKPGNWDIYARSLYQDTWGPLIRLTDDPKPDINHHVTADKKGNIYVVWQAHPENNGDIMLAVLKEAEWSKPFAITSDSSSDWFPQVAVDLQGKAWIVFDSYRNGNYDVFLTSFEEGAVGDIIPVATSGYYEAHASLTCSPDGRIWIAWEQGGFDWGKKRRHLLNEQQDFPVESMLGLPRSVEVAVYYENQMWAGPKIVDAMPNAKENVNAMPKIVSDKGGRIWLGFRHLNSGSKATLWKEGGKKYYWSEYITYLIGTGWITPLYLPGSEGRKTVFSRILPVDKSVMVSFSSDLRGTTDYDRPVQDNVFVVKLPKPAQKKGMPDLRPYLPPEPPARIRYKVRGKEAADVKQARNHKVYIEDEQHKLFRGDLHRHSEFSRDASPGYGSFLDFYRYMIDVVNVDFGAIADHQGNEHYAYWWWLTQKSGDMYYLAPRFVPIYGYERNVGFPNGHRNIFHSSRGIPTIPLRLIPDQAGGASSNMASNVMTNDTKLLYQFLHHTDGISIPHKTATAQGTDWRDNDPVVEPVVEIDPGLRDSYDALGNSLISDPENFSEKEKLKNREEGMVSNAWVKGYRLGVIFSSDPESSRSGYAMVYASRNDRNSIFKSIRNRRTYGATDNIIVDFQANGHFMGDEFTTDEIPFFELHITGADAIEKVDLIRNGSEIYSFYPGKKEVDLNYVDDEAITGLNYYYFRIAQEDGEIAWTSPIWIHFGQKYE